MRSAVPPGLAAALAAGLMTAPALAAAAPVGATPVGATTATQPIRTSIPAPTGRHRIGTVSLHLVDPTRTDPLVPNHPTREIMVQMWYPASDAEAYPTAPYLPPLAAAQLEADQGLPHGSVVWPRTVGHQGAPVDHRHGPRPVVLYSTAGNSVRALGTGQVEDLASHGYIVIALDATHEASEVEFPGGRLELPGPQSGDDALTVQQVAVRAADTRFVLNQLAELNKGGNPDAEHDTLPKGLAGSLDLNRIGMFGWSLGGAATAQAMADDPRIKAGINLSGTFFGPVATTGVTRPFMLMSQYPHPLEIDPTWASFWAHSTGPKFALALANSAHQSWSDAEQLYGQLAGLLGLTHEQLVDLIGTIDPTTATRDQRVYIRAFFDHYLRDRHSHLLDGPSPRYPDITFGP
ncbi:lipase [Streptosporangiaceae bacterium NEAU-GS5]|nr:lipase [Streptosporangiaceae bacterium NEAU-GS5]